MLNVRDAVIEDFDDIMKIYHFAQDFMIQNGNPTQWGHSYPDTSLVQSDIMQGLCKVVYDEKRIHGVFVLLTTPEPAYAKIEQGAWLNQDPYITIHRVAGDGTVHGIFRSIIEHCSALSGNIRIDTHADNKNMQRLIEKNGFTKCGIIHLEDGSARLAYQRSVNTTPAEA